MARKAAGKISNPREHIEPARKKTAPKKSAKAGGKERAMDAQNEVTAKVTIVDREAHGRGEHTGDGGVRRAVIKH